MLIKNREELSIPCIEVDLSEGLRLTALLLAELTLHDAVGLAANQIGEKGRVFVLLIEDQVHVYINPVLVGYSKDSINYKEGCLSFPEEHVTTMRYSQVYVKDLLNPKERLLTGLAAIAFQHELDHLDGITFHSRAKPT